MVQLAGRPGLERRVEETRWGEVDREAERWLTTGPAVGLDLAGPGENQLDDEAVELDRTVRVDRGLDDGADRLRQHRHVWPEEAFVLVELAVRQVDDRLERDLVDVAHVEEVIERLGLDDLAGLGHADAIGQAGLEHSRRHRREVARTLGQGRIEGDQAVGGRVDGGRDLGGARVRQLRGRGDDDHSGFELELAGAADVELQEPRESDVTRPEQPLLANGLSRRQKTHRTRHPPAACRRDCVSTIPAPDTRPLCVLAPPNPMCQQSRAAPGPLYPRLSGPARRHASRSPAWIGMSRRFSGGASGQAHFGSNAQEG